MADEYRLEGGLVKPGIDVVVVNYRTPGLLEAFLRSNHLHGAPVESDTWVAQVDPLDADLQVPTFGAHCIVHDTNVGFARAVNDAVARGEREFLAIFNSDTELLETTMRQCISALEENPDWGVLGPRQVDRNNRLTHAGIFGTLERPAHRAWRAADSHEFWDIREAVTVSGSAYFTRRSMWNQLTECPIYRDLYPDAGGAFLPTQHYYEETWCSYHAQAHDWKVMYYGPARMIHHWHMSSKVGSIEREMKKSQIMFRHACDSHGIPHD